MEMETGKHQEEKYKPVERASESESWGGIIPEKLRWNLDTVPSFSISTTWSANNRQPVAARAGVTQISVSQQKKKKNVHRGKIIR